VVVCGGTGVEQLAKTAQYPRETGGRSRQGQCFQSELSSLQCLDIVEVQFGKKTCVTDLKTSRPEEVENENREEPAVAECVPDANPRT